VIIINLLFELFWRIYSENSTNKIMKVHIITLIVLVVLIAQCMMKSKASIVSLVYESAATEYWMKFDTNTMNVTTKVESYNRLFGQIAIDTKNNRFYTMTTTGIAIFDLSTCEIVGNVRIALPKPFETYTLYYDSDLNLLIFESYQTPDYFTLYDVKTSQFQKVSRPINAYGSRSAYDSKGKRLLYYSTAGGISIIDLKGKLLSIVPFNAGIYRPIYDTVKNRLLGSNGTDIVEISGLDPDALNPKLSSIGNYGWKQIETHTLDAYNGIIYAQNLHNIDELYSINVNEKKIVKSFNIKGFHLANAQFVPDEK
jgi:hypothetical protein